MGDDDADYSLLSVATVDMLRQLADRIRNESGCVMYGHFPGGDPREFTPDADACSADELEAHRRACELMERGEIDCVDGRHHWPILDAEGNVIGHSTHVRFGIGTYSYEDEAALELARKLDDWIDEARRVL